MSSIDKVFSIINILKNSGELKLQEIADKLSLHKSTAHRYVSELCRNNYLERDNETKTYRLGFNFLDIASYIIENLDIREKAKKSIEELNAVTRETIHLGLLLGDHAIYIEKKESLHSIRMYSQIGRVAPLHCTGVGKAILAFQPPEFLKKLLDSITFHKYTENTIITREQLLKEIDVINKNGYAVDNEEHEKNIGCIAAPIWDYTKRVVASVSITAILYRLEMESLIKYKPLILEKSYEISRRLGYEKKRI